jgi:Major Facilitator Superfamily
MTRLYWGILLSNLGNGAWYTSWALFLTKHLTPAQVGLGMAVAGALGMLAATPLGQLGDRLGPRETLTALLLVQAAGSLLFLAHGYAAFQAAACITTVASQGSGGVRAALVSGLADDRMTALARLRVYNHVGAAAGAALGGLVIGLDAGFAALIGFNALTFVAYAALVATTPRVPPLPARGLIVLKDGPYVALAGMIGVLSLCWGMLSTGVPLWIAHHTDASPALAAGIVVVNSVGIALLQVRATRTARTPLAAARTALWSGALLATSCLLFATGLTPLLLAAGLVHLGGELLFVAASWGLSIPLMPPDAPGQYQGMFATGQATAQMLAPALMTTLIAGWGQAGWLVLAAIFLVATAPAMPATRWALRTRTAHYTS